MSQEIDANLTQWRRELGPGGTDKVFDVLLVGRAGQCSVRSQLDIAVKRALIEFKAAVVAIEVSFARDGAERRRSVEAKQNFCSLLCI